VPSVLLTVVDPRREFPWLLSAVLTALRGDDAVVRMPYITDLYPPHGAIPLESDDEVGLNRVAAEAVDIARLDGVVVEVSPLEGVVVEVVSGG